MHSWNREMMGVREWESGTIGVHPQIFKGRHVGDDDDISFQGNNPSRKPKDASTHLWMASIVNMLA
jgi:hypothetical protein